jgi:hypothetical protein
MRPAQGGVVSDSESERDPHDEDEDGMIYTTNHLAHGTNFRSRRHSKGITTAPGQLGAGETETEADEPVSHAFHDIKGFFFKVFVVIPLAETPANRTDSPSFRSVGTAKQPRASDHTALVRGVSFAVNCSCRIWCAVQSVPCVVSTHKRKHHSHRLCHVCIMGTSF